VGRIAEGDQGALAELYDRFGSLLVGLSNRILRDPSDAEEVVQEAFVQVWKQAGRYDPRRSSVSTWLVLIARSRSIDRLRSRQVRDRTALAAGKEQPRHTSQEGMASVWYDERRQRLNEVMATLPLEQREVLELSYYQGLTQREIAESTGIPLGTVKTRTLLAMKKLRTALADEIETLL